MFPKIRKVGVSKSIKVVSHIFINCFTTPVYTIFWILDFCPSQANEIAHRLSIRFYLSSISFFTIWHRQIMPFLIRSYLGMGDPLHKFDMVQLSCLIIILSFDELAIFINWSNAPVFNIMSLYWTQSPERFPIAHTAWSTIPGLF